MKKKYIAPYSLCEEIIDEEIIATSSTQYDDVNGYNLNKSEEEEKIITTDNFNNFKF